MYVMYVHYIELMSTEVGVLACSQNSIALVMEIAIVFCGAKPNLYNVDT